jgi:hypothetical protein
MPGVLITIHPIRLSLDALQRRIGQASNSHRLRMRAAGLPIPAYLDIIADPDQHLATVGDALTSLRYLIDTLMGNECEAQRPF